MPSHGLCRLWGFRNEENELGFDLFLDWDITGVVDVGFGKECAAAILSLARN